MFKVQTIGLKEIERDLKADARTVKRHMARGLKKASLIVIRKAKKVYLRKTALDDSRSMRALGKHKLGRVSGQAARTLTYKVNERKGEALVGWWRNKYLHVVAEPRKGRTKTTIRPKRSKVLVFPLTKRARNVWHMRGRKPKTWQTKNKKSRGIIVAGRKLKFGRDYTIAKKVTIRARFPISKALQAEGKKVEKVVLESISVLGKKEK